MPLDSAAKEKLGGAMNLVVDPNTGAVRILVVRPPDAHGNIQLGQDDKGNLQLSPAWVARMIGLLPADEQVVVANSLLNRTILTGVSYLDAKGTALNILWLEVSDSGSVQVLKGDPANPFAR